MESPQMESARFRDMIDVNEKFCVDCKTSKTPLWRSGPAGPKSLCNACGIRYRKKKGIVVSDNNKDKQRPSPSSSASSTTAASSTTTAGNRNSGEDSGGVEKKGIISNNLRIKLVALGKEVVLMKRQRSPTKKKMMRQRSEDHDQRKLGEVEEAAFLLMSLSYGSVFA